MTGEAAGDRSEKPHIFLIAGEPSGDLLGARLMAALSEACHGQIRFSGVGGPRMEEQGLASLFPMAELSVMGLVEVLPHIPRLYRRLGETTEAVLRACPDAVVTIDAPNFTLPVAKRIRQARHTGGKPIALVHYVAPSVWAWKPGRAKRLAGIVDHLLALLPFEPPYFERHGLATTFVGHPAIESRPPAGAGSTFRKARDIPLGAPLLAVLPGSRLGEVRRHEPIFAAVLERLKGRFAGLQAVVPMPATLVASVQRIVRRWPVPAMVVEGEAEKLAAFAAADVALAASGTVAVELAVARTPAVIGYRVNPLTAAIAKRLIKVDMASIPNLLLQQRIQPEFLQERCTPALLSEATATLLGDTSARQQQIEDCGRAVAMLSPEGGTPSQRAAHAVLQAIAQAKRSKRAP